MLILAVIAAYAAAYLLGSVNSAVIISKLLYGDDVRNYGSGNAGTTNMLRTYGAKAAGLTFLGDVLKGVIAVWLARVIFNAMGFSNEAVYAAYTAAFCSMMGHMFPIYFRFKGGKGVATGLGAVFTINPLIFGMIFPIGLAIAGFSGFVSLGSLTGAVLFPIFVAAMSIKNTGAINVFELILALVLAIVVIYNHRENIKRLLSGTENKFYKKK